MAKKARKQKSPVRKTSRPAAKRPVKRKVERFAIEDQEDNPERLSYEDLQRLL